MASPEAATWPQDSNEMAIQNFFVRGRVRPRVGADKVGWPNRWATTVVLIRLHIQLLFKPWYFYWHVSNVGCGPVDIALGAEFNKHVVLNLIHAGLNSKFF